MPWRPCHQVAAQGTTPDVDADCEDWQVVGWLGPELCVALTCPQVRALVALMAKNIMDTRAAIATVSDMTARKSTPCWPIVSWRVVSWRAGADRRLARPVACPGPSSSVPGFSSSPARRVKSTNIDVRRASPACSTVSIPSRTCCSRAGRLIAYPDPPVPGAGHPPAATPAASTRPPRDSTTTWPSCSRVLRSTQNIGCLPASAARQGPDPAASSPTPVSTLRRTPAVSYSAVPRPTSGTGFPFAVCAAGAAARGDEDR
jgi:hypothetical protein